MARAGEDDAGYRGPRNDYAGPDRLWHRALSPPGGPSRSPAPEGDADLGSGTGTHWLFHGRSSSRCRGKRSPEAEDSDRINLCRWVASLPGPRDLRPPLDRRTDGPGYHRQGGGDQLLLRYADVCGSDSYAGERHAAHLRRHALTHLPVSLRRGTGITLVLRRQR